MPEVADESVESSAEAPPSDTESPTYGADAAEYFEPEDLPDPPKHPGGRPPKGKVAPAAMEPFPKPPKSCLKGGYITGDKFFNYWKTLPKQCADRVLVYIYREYPKMNYMLALSDEERDDVFKKKRRPPTKNIAKFSEPFPSNDWRDEMLRRFGEGDYKIILNDSGTKAATPFAQNICKAWVELRDEDYPPVIEDIRCVDPNDPVNQSYLKKLEMAGLLNRAVPQEKTEEETEDMALSSVVKDLSDKMIQMAERPQAATPTVIDPDTAAASRVVDVMAAGAIKHQELGNKIIGDALDTANKIRVEQADPLGKILPVIEAIKTLIPAPAAANTNSADMITLFGKMLEVQKAASDTVIQNMQQQLEATRLMHKEAMDRLAGQTNPTPAATGETSELKILNNMLNIKAKLDELAGGANESGIPGWIPYALQGAKILGDVVTNVFHNAAVAKTGQGQPLPPPETTAELPEGEEEGADGPAQYPIYARQIHAPMREALLTKTPGHEFGAKICFAMKDTRPYEFLVSQGKEGLMRLLQSAPEVWGTFLQFGEGRQNEIFLEEFLDRDAVMAKIEELKNPKPQVIRTRPIVAGDGSIKRGAGPVVNATAEPA
jgi:hypothetical protein